MCSLVLSVGYMHYFYRISMGLCVPASYASLSLYPTTAQALVSDPDHSLVTFSGCGAFRWITAPTLCHQLAPEGWRLLAALSVHWTVSFIDPIKVILKCCCCNVNKDPLSVPHLPH